MERTVSIVNKLGLHARAAAKLVTTATGFSADIKVRKDGKEVSGKSIMGVLMLAAEQGSTLRVAAHGDDAGDAVAALAELVGRGFEEN